MATIGPQNLIAGNSTAGFYGEVPTSQLISYVNLASQLGLTAGTSFNTGTSWLKFSIDEKIIFVAKKPVRYNLSWQDLNTVNAVFGNKVIDIGGVNYKVRLIKGGNADPTDRNTGAQGSEWNRLMLPISQNASTGNWDYPKFIEEVVPNWGTKYTDYDLGLGSGGSQGNYTLCQESVLGLTGYRINRGGLSVENMTTYSGAAGVNYGWRPVLELDNAVPIVTINNPTTNITLHENDTFAISGTVSDADVGNSVTVRYQLNAEPARAIKAFISTGAVEAFSKSLTFKAGKLFDGETAVTGVLTDGVAHKLKVYATDDQGGTSPIVERTFYAVPNRAPALTVDAVTPSGIIDTDAFDISGSYSDQDGNTTTVRYKINGSNPVQIAQGTTGAWSFTLPLGKLVVGENTIVIEAEDTYGAKTSKTVKLRKQEVKTSIKTGVARYKIEPPTGTAQEVMLWVQHDANLTLDTSISMTQTAEAEAYVPMALTNTATLSNGQVESEFYYNASAAKENIIVQITQTKTTADANEKITLISGVL